MKKILFTSALLLVMFSAYQYYKYKSIKKLYVYPKLEKVSNNEYLIKDIFDSTKIYKLSKRNKYFNQNLNILENQNYNDISLLAFNDDRAITDEIKTISLDLPDSHNCNNRSIEPTCVTPLNNVYKKREMHNYINKYSFTPISKQIALKIIEDFTIIMDKDKLDYTCPANCEKIAEFINQFFEKKNNIGTKKAFYLSKKVGGCIQSKFFVNTWVYHVAGVLKIKEANGTIRNYVVDFPSSRGDKNLFLVPYEKWKIDFFKSNSTDTVFIESASIYNYRVTDIDIFPTKVASSDFIKPINAEIFRLNELQKLKN